MTNKNRVEGKGRELGGSVEEKAGQVTGDEDMEARGAAKKGQGKVQGAAGKVQDAIDDVKDAVTGH